MSLIFIFAAEAAAGSLVAFLLGWAMVRGPKSDRYKMPWWAGVTAFLAICLCVGAIRYFTAYLGIYNTVDLV